MTAPAAPAEQRLVRPDAPPADAEPAHRVGTGPTLIRVALDCTGSVDATFRRPPKKATAPTLAAVEAALLGRLGTFRAGPGRDAHLEYCGFGKTTVCDDSSLGLDGLCARLAQRPAKGSTRRVLDVTSSDPGQALNAALTDRDRRADVAIVITDGLATRRAPGASAAGVSIPGEVLRTFPVKDYAAAIRDDDAAFFSVVLGSVAARPVAPKGPLSAPVALFVLGPNDPDLDRRLEGFLADVAAAAPAAVAVKGLPDAVFRPTATARIGLTSREDAPGASTIPAFNEQPCVAGGGGRSIELNCVARHVPATPRPLRQPQAELYAVRLQVGFEPRPLADSNAWTTLRPDVQWVDRGLTLSLDANRLVDAGAADLGERLLDGTLRQVQLPPSAGCSDARRGVAAALGSTSAAPNEPELTRTFLIPARCFDPSQPEAELIVRARPTAGSTDAIQRHVAATLAASFAGASAIPGVREFVSDIAEDVAGLRFSRDPTPLPIVRIRLTQEAATP